MTYLQKYYKKLSTEKLRTERSLIQERIDEVLNITLTDEYFATRLSTDMDKRDIIDTILAKRYSGSI